MQRREFLAAAAALGAHGVWGFRIPERSGARWQERRDLYPEGVASGDPGSDSVLLWTRRPGDTTPIELAVEVAEDSAFLRVIAKGRARANPDADWTVRVLVGGLRPDREYWYRFTDPDGAGSRVGRTRTSPVDSDGRPARFAFVSCQDINTGYLNAWRRMIHEDEKASADQRLDFILHLGDFVYEMVWYPEDRQSYLGRTIREVLRFPTGQKIGDFHIPVDVEDYRLLYRAYLHEPELQDARARWAFVTMWDNHEFSWQGRQSIQRFGGRSAPAQTRKVAANQAWWEYQPARVQTPARSLEAFHPPSVANTAIDQFDEHGLGLEPNNLAAIRSLTAYRTLRFGKHLELFITDQHSYRSEDPASSREAAALAHRDFSYFVPQEAQEILDAGRAANAGDPPATITFGSQEVPNFRRDQPPQTILGAEQKAWFLDRLGRSRATWKVWGNSKAILDHRADPQNLPSGLTPAPWPGAGYAGFGGGDPSTAYTERAEIYDFVAERGITGFACVSGDRHAFWAGLMSKSLPPARFQPIGVAFVTGAISSAGFTEALELRMPASNPLRPLFLVDRAAGPPDATINMLLKHGVRSCLEYAASRDRERARALSNPDNAPHLSFVDAGAQGYAVVRVGSDAMECEFVCIERPKQRATGEDGGPLRYRLVHRAALWRSGEAPKLDARVVSGDPGLGR
jgi:alkaline phosphatase D